MFSARNVGLTLAVSAALLAAHPAAAQSATFNFDSDAVGTTTAFTDTNNGLSATFNSPNDPGIFAVQPSFFQNQSGNDLGPGQIGANFVPLNIAFSKSLTSFSVNFGLNGMTTDTFTVTAFSGGLGGTKVGTASASGAIPGNPFFFPEGSLSFQSASPFDTVALTSTAQNFAVDNIVVSAPVPEASTTVSLGLLLMLGCGGLAWSARRRTAGPDA